MSTKADRLHAAPETIKQSNESPLSSPQEREVLTALKELVAELRHYQIVPIAMLAGEPLGQFSAALAQAKAAIAKAESAPSVGQQWKDFARHKASCARVVCQHCGYIKSVHNTSARIAAGLPPICKTFTPTPCDCGAELLALPVGQRESDLTDVKASLEQIVALQPEAIRILRKHDFVFRRFPRDMKKQPPINEEERWEALAYTFYTLVGQAHSQANAALETIESASSVAAAPAWRAMEQVLRAILDDASAYQWHGPVRRVIQQGDTERQGHRTLCKSCFGEIEADGWSVHGGRDVADRLKAAASRAGGVDRGGDDSARGEPAGEV